MRKRNHAAAIDFAEDEAFFAIRDFIKFIDGEDNEENTFQVYVRVGPKQRSIIIQKFQELFTISNIDNSQDLTVNFTITPNIFF